MVSVICILHSLISLICVSLIMFYRKEISILGHGIETARMLSGSTPHDQLLIQASNSLAGLLLFIVGFSLVMVAFVKDRVFFSLHNSIAFWRVYFERRLEVLAWDWPRQVIGDFILALSWVFFLVYSWREKYD